MYYIYVLTITIKAIAQKLRLNGVLSANFGILSKSEKLLINLRGNVRLLVLFLI